jgi:hypothetical protein
MTFVCDIVEPLVALEFLLIIGLTLLAQNRKVQLRLR